MALSMNDPVINASLLRHEHLLTTLVKHANIPAAKIEEAIMYSLFPGGKRLRPTLVYLCGKLIGVDNHSLDHIAAAVEIIHCYSLVHDDLPAMDDDDMRRGKPSCHRAFNEATAILVGDGMQALAIEILLTHLPQTLPLDKVIAIANELVKASGLAGMVSGQSLDLTELTNPQLNESRLSEIHTLKTGKLILACINMVLAASNTSPEKAEALQRFATHLGLVFQMQDDYLDKYSSGALGKNRASDTANKKITFASLYNQQDLLTLINDYYQQAADSLTIFGQHTTDLLLLLSSLKQRISH